MRSSSPGAQNNIMLPKMNNHLLFPESLLPIGGHFFQTKITGFTPEVTMSQGNECDKTKLSPFHLLQAVSKLAMRLTEDYTGEVN
jgi:hypothetical protein